ncbi:hypothetical protein WJX72_007905 [[Myrmecia] bisecta]|uniref:Transmembrane protein n=1 Tax=[Myrmecia] bisecta TaxID=41462 RepID=A0AAW1PKG1_9CHLO
MPREAALLQAKKLQEPAAQRCSPLLGASRHQSRRRLWRIVSGNKLQHMAPIGLRLGLGVGGFVAVATFIALQQLQQHQEQERVYWGPFQQQPVSTSNRTQDDDGNLRRDLLKEVENRLRALRRMQPGPARSRQIRQLRSTYHPDRASCMPALQPLFNEITRLVNSRTDPMLEQDRRAIEATVLQQHI